MYFQQDGAPPRYALTVREYLVVVVVAHWKVGPAPVFGASQPLEPAEWLALLILKAGDVESIFIRPFRSVGLEGRAALNGQHVHLT